MRRCGRRGRARSTRYRSMPSPLCAQCRRVAPEGVLSYNDTKLAVRDFDVAGCLTRAGAKLNWLLFRNTGFRRRSFALAGIVRFAMQRDEMGCAAMHPVELGEQVSWHVSPGSISRPTSAWL